MPQSSGLSIWLILALVILVWPVFFVALWSGIVLAMSWLGGWHRLAKVYRTEEPPTGGRVFRNVAGMAGIARYKKVLTVVTGEDGMFLHVRWVFRMAHPPLFIPWSDVRKARKVTLFYWDYVAFEVGNPAIANMRMPVQIFDGTPVFVES